MRIMIKIRIIRILHKKHGDGKDRTDHDDAKILG